MQIHEQNVAFQYPSDGKHVSYLNDIKHVVKSKCRLRYNSLGTLA